MKGQIEDNCNDDNEKKIITSRRKMILKRHSD